MTGSSLHSPRGNPDTTDGAAYQEWLAQADILGQNGRENRAIHCPAEFLYGSTPKIPN